MKNLLILLMIIICSLPANADVSSYIESFNSSFDKEIYKSFDQLIKGSTSISDLEKQLILDKEIEKELNSTFIYTDLEECIKTAIGENYEIKIDEQVRNAAFWEHKNAQFQLLPNIYYDYNIKNLEGNYLVGGIVATTTHEVPVQSVFMLEWSTINQGRYFFNLAQRRNQLKAAKANLEYTKEETILKTTLYYYDVLEKKMEIEVEKTNLFNRLEQLRYTKARFDTGIGTLYDVKRAEAEVARAEQSYIQALNSLRLKQANLANIVGVDILDAVYPYEIRVDDRQLINPDYNIDELFKQALNSREDIKAKKAEIEVFKAIRNSNYTDIIPSVRLSYQNGFVGTKRMGLSNHNSLTFDITANFGKNLLTGTITQVKADNAVVKQKKLELINLERKIKEDILNSYYNSSSCLKKIEAAKIEVEAANLSLELSLANMKAGEATFIDVIASQNLKVQANINLIRNMIEYNKAQTQLLFDIGIISPKNVLKDYQTRLY